MSDFIVCLWPIAILGIVLVIAAYNWRKWLPRTALRRLHPRTGFAAMYPFWCGTCKAFRQEDEVYYAWRATELDGAVLPVCMTCHTEVGEYHDSHPRRVFADIRKGSATFANMNARSQSLLEDAFDAAYGDFKTGRMSAELASRFERTFQDVDQLLKFLVENHYEINW